MKIEQLRQYHSKRTTAVLIVDGVEAGLTIEDVGRPGGIKIPKETCIPEGLYKAKITYSPKFKRNMILLYTNPQNYACELENIVFTGIRVHRGSTTDHTEGCPLYQGDLNALENAIAEAERRGEEVLWEIGRDDSPVVNS
jgi:hypothetical protein